MKAYILTEKDFNNLLANIDRDPRYGMTGGSSAVLQPVEQEAYVKAHDFFNYQVRTWLSEVKKDS